VQNTSFQDTQTILAALEYALRNGAFGANASQKKAAARLIRDMQSTRYVSGRHQQILRLLRKGVTVEQMMSATGASRRTIFRYLNQLEDGGVSIELTESHYHLK
jgi:DNA-binding NarL/FixJ family response regulator